MYLLTPTDFRVKRKEGVCVLNAVIKNSIHVAILLNKSINQEEEEKCKPQNRN